MGLLTLYTTPSLIVVDAEACKKICDIYDWDGKGELDLFYLGDIMYAMGFNTTKKVCVGLGQTDEEGKKFAKFDDVVAMCEAGAKTPDSQGSYFEYLELLKLDDLLCNLGDEIPKADMTKLFADLCEPEDEDGMFPYMSFLDKLVGTAWDGLELTSTFLLIGRQLPMTEWFH